MGQTGRRPKLTEAQEAELVRLALEGVTYRVLAARFGMSRTTVCDVLERHGARKKDRAGAVDPRRALPLGERDDGYRAPG